MSSPTPVLVLGGCGFVGFHVTAHFSSSPDYAVHVGSRSPSKNRLPDVTYHPVDITSRPQVEALLAETKTRIVVHAACPSPTAGTASVFRDIIVDGTSNVVAAAKASPHCQALVFTSSSTMAKGREHLDLGEDCALADEDPSAHPYAATKARADRSVRAANRVPSAEAVRTGDFTGYLATACLRLPIVYGERDDRSIVGALEAFEKGQTNFQIGDGSNLWDFCSDANAGKAHVLLARMLLGGASDQAAGEAFNISDGERHLFWDYARTIWRVAGWKEKEGKAKTWILPTPLALAIAHATEWIFWICTLGTRRPGLMGLQQVEYMCFTHTYSIEKARRVLGFEPVPEFEAGLKRSLDWAKENLGWQARLQKR